MKEEPNEGQPLLGAAAARELAADEVSRLYRDRHLGDLTRVASLLGAALDVIDSDGAWLVLRDGSRVLDCHASYGAVAFGHHHPALVEAARESLARMATGLPGLLPSPRVAVLCHDLVAIAPEGLTRALLYNSGAETIEGDRPRDPRPGQARSLRRIRGRLPRQDGCGANARWHRQRAQRFPRLGERRDAALW